MTHKQEIDNISKQVDELSVDYFNSIDIVVNEYTSSLDNLMNKLYSLIQDKDSISDKDIENYSLNLASILYMVSSKLEKTGILDDISKILKQEEYNKVYLDKQNEAIANNVKLTVAQTQALAEEGSKYNTMMNSIYSRVYKQVKQKIDSGYEMLKLLSKIMSKRMEDNKNNFDRNSSRIPLMEDINNNNRKVF